MRIWMVNQYAISPAQSGGTRHYSLARELVARGHEVLIIASSFDHTTRRELHLAPGESSKIETVDGVSFLWLRTSGYSGNTVRRMVNMVEFAWKLITERATRKLPSPDVVIGSSPHLFAASAAKVVARRRNAAFVLEVRDLWPQSLVDLGSISGSHPLIMTLAWLERDLYRSAQRIISLLPAADGHMVDKGASRDRIAWLPNGIDLSLVPELPKPAVNPRFTVMFAGAHGLANGLDVVLDAAAILHRDGLEEKVLFRLVGDGPDKPRLQQRAASDGLTNVQFDDPVPKSRIYQVLGEADAFVMVLKDSPVFRWGVSPNKLFDYMAVGRPIIFAVNAPNDPVALAEAGRSVPAGDPAALAAAVKELAGATPEERRQMGLRARAYVEENHSFERLGERLERLLAELAPN